MHVIGHHHEFIQQDMGKMFGDRQPTFPNDVPDLIGRITPSVKSPNNHARSLLQMVMKYAPAWV